MAGRRHGWRVSVGLPFRWLLVAFSLGVGSVPAYAAYQWGDSFGKTWRTYQEACVFGEFNARLDTRRAANPSLLYRIGSLSIQVVDPTEAVCRGNIQRRVGFVWVTDEVIDTSNIRSGSADACALSDYSDPETGLCGSPKNHGSCPASGVNGSNPIDTASGNKFQRETDYVGVGNHPIVFERFYNSRDLASAGLGATWRHSYSRSLLILDTGDANAFVKAFRHNGRVLRFSFSGSVCSRRRTSPSAWQRVEATGS